MLAFNQGRMGDEIQADLLPFLGSQRVLLQQACIFPV